MKIECVLGVLKKGECFLFGNVKFQVSMLADPKDPDGFTSCLIYGTQATVHITACAWITITS